MIGEEDVAQRLLDLVRFCWSGDPAGAPAYSDRVEHLIKAVIAPDVAVLLYGELVPLEKELAAARKDQQWLDALEAAGVDNWEGYSHAHEILREWGGDDEDDED